MGSRADLRQLLPGHSSLLPSLLSLSLCQTLLTFLRKKLTFLTRQAYRQYTDNSNTLHTTLEDSNVIHSRSQLRLAPSLLCFLRLSSVKLHSSLAFPTTESLWALEHASVTRPKIHPPDLIRVKIQKILGQQSCSNKTNKSNKFPNSDRFNHNSSYLTTNLGNADHQVYFCI